MSIHSKFATLQNNPRRAVRVAIYNFAMKANKGYSKCLYQLTRRGTDPFSRDWDNLIILDACRNDMINGHFQSADSKSTLVSPGTHTVDFLQKVTQRNLDDVVWVSATPQVERFSNKIYRVEKLYRENWDSELGTVHPKGVFEHAKSIRSKFPNKRIVVHFLQPHYPFISSVVDLPSNRGVDMTGRSNSEETVWEYLRYNNYSSDDLEKVKRAYEENLEVVSDYAEKLANIMGGKSVITSDHGNLVGERGFPIPIRIFGHPQRYRHKKLVNVPWIVFESGSRPEITTGDGSDSQTSNTDVADQLNALGYK